MSYAERFQWIFETRGTNASALAEKAGLGRSHIRGIIANEKEGKKVRPGPEVLEALAKAANVSYRWLSSGKGPREPYEVGAAEVETTPSAPATPTASETELDRLIDGAMTKDHGYLDGVIVRQALFKAPAPQEAAESQVYVRRLLDAAAWHRKRGHSIRAEDLPALAVVLLDQELARRAPAGAPAPPADTKTRKAS